MSTYPHSFEGLLGGSLVRFRERKRPPFSEHEKKIQRENERQLEEGLQVLRRFRTRVLNEPDPSVRQRTLQEAHRLSSFMADTIVEQALHDRPQPLEPSFAGTLKQISKEQQDQDAGSAHGLPPQFSIGNLLKAADDILIRIEEKTRSHPRPDQALNEAEMCDALIEWLRGTNDLPIDAVKKLFSPQTKVGGILSGGSVYAEIAKNLTKRFGMPSLTFETFVIAVDKERKQVVMEASDADPSTQSVIVTDDMIDKGGTMLTALWNVGAQFPHATIYSGKGTDRPGGFERRSTQEQTEYLFGLFQDFADRIDDDENTEALAIFQRAEQYANEHGISLLPGWYRRKKRIVQAS